MSYTLLRVAQGGVVLGDYHLRRLGLTVGTGAHAAFAAFAREAAPGVWAVEDDGRRLVAEPRGESRLVEGMATRFAASPLCGLTGEQPKPGPGGIYDSVRAPGLATLLTTADGAEILEACVAAVVGWDGARLVCVPRDRPRVWSCAEQAIREHLEPRVAPLRTGSDEPLLLVNAVKGACAVEARGRAQFPETARLEIDGLLASLTGRPAA